MTVQKICRVCKDEKDVRSVLQDVWNQPSRVEEVLSEALDKNRNVYTFERVLTK